MPWEKKYDDADVLERAARAFWVRGYEATSMADLVAATGINRGSIYSAFTDKRGLFRRALRHYDQVYRSQFLARLAMEHGPRAAIIAAFRSAAAPAEGRPPGCLMVNTALELSPHDDQIAADVRAGLDGLRAFFADRLDAAREAGEVPASLPVEATVASLHAMFLGLRVMARAGHDPAEGDRVIAQVEALLG